MLLSSLKDLGILNISKNLSDLAKSEKKSDKKYEVTCYDYFPFYKDIMWLLYKNALADIIFLSCIGNPS